MRRIAIKLESKNLAAIVAKPKNLLPRTPGQLPCSRVAYREDKQLPFAQTLEFCRTIIVGALIQRLSSMHNAPFYTIPIPLFASVKTKIPAMTLLFIH
jgi:hypothetical protein